MENNFLKKVKASHKVFLNIKKKNHQLLDLELSSFEEDVQYEIEQLLDLEMALLKEDQIFNWNKHLKLFSEKHSLWHDVFIYSEKQLLLENITYGENVLILKLSLSDFYLYLKHGPMGDFWPSLNTELLVEMINRSLLSYKQKLLKTEDLELMTLENEINKIDHPLAIISSLGDLLFLNQAYKKMGILPHDCLKLKDQQKMVIGEECFMVRKKEFQFGLGPAIFFIVITVKFSSMENL